MKADDDTFIMVENLRRLLKKYDPNKPHFFGRCGFMCALLLATMADHGCTGKRFLLHRGNGALELSYNSGGAGYVLSRGALKLLVSLRLGRALLGGWRLETLVYSTGLAGDDIRW